MTLYLTRRKIDIGVPAGSCAQEKKMQPGIRITRAEVETLGGFLMAARGAIAIRHPAAATSAIGVTPASNSENALLGRQTFDKRPYPVLVLLYLALNVLVMSEQRIRVQSHLHKGIYRRERCLAWSPEPI